MRYYLLAGELSGDQHGAALIRAIKAIDSEATFRGMGGDACAAEGMDLHRHYKAQNVMGFSEIIRHLPKLLRFLNETKKDLLDWKPDVVIPIDYPGFNLRIAKFAHQKGFPVDYFIPPQIWAWHSSRAFTLKKYCRQIFCILPFEPDFYKRYGITATYVGNPLTDEIAFGPSDQRQANTLLLMPGSRPMEIKKMLPVMLEASEKLSHFQEVVVAGLRTIPAELYHEVQQYPKARVVFDETRDWLQKAEAALITSGTATLEGGLAGIPLVVCYKGNPISVALARKLIQVPYISLVNLIGNPGFLSGKIGQPLVIECIQENCTPNKLAEALKVTLAQREKLIHQFLILRKQLNHKEGIAVAAKHIVFK